MRLAGARSLCELSHINQEVDTACWSQLRDDPVSTDPWKNKMALPTNEELASCELSIEQLETIAAGGILGDIGHWIKSEVTGWVHDKITEYHAFKDMIIQTGRTIWNLF
jgi:hypothetical protein